MEYIYIKYITIKFNAYNIILLEKFEIRDQTLWMYYNS